jgi:hypothetical protein
MSEAGCASSFSKDFPVISRIFVRFMPFLYLCAAKMVVVDTYFCS